MQQSQGGLRKGVETWWPLPSIIDKEVECISLGNSRGPMGGDPVDPHLQGGEPPVSPSRSEWLPP
jgi:hypothetical protein